MDSSNAFGSSSSGSARNRHSDQQTQRLEAYFTINQHPNERERDQLGSEIGLTSTQIKFWFQNKRTLAKKQSERLEGNALKEANEMIKNENLAMGEALKDVSCSSCMFCKGVSPNEHEKLRMSSLKAENELLKAQLAKVTNILAQSGFPMQEIISPHPSSGSVPQIPQLGNGFNNPNMLNELTSEQRQKHNQDFDIARIVQIATSAVQELTELMTQESLWIKDPSDGRFRIHRNNYENTFMSNTHLSTSNTRVESSKEDGVVRMRGAQLVAMLQNSSRRLDLFPAIVTKAITRYQFPVGDSASGGALQLINEQIHILSPLVPPREFDLIRYSEQIDSSSWIIVDVSHNLPNDDNFQKSTFRTWKFPSGCLIKDLANGFSKVSWVEHIEVHDNDLIHPLYRETIFGSLGYGAQRWILTLQRMCERFATQMGDGSINTEIETITNPQGRQSIMNLATRMMRNMFANLSMKSKFDISHFQQDNSDTQVKVYESSGPGLPDGMIFSATATLGIPLSYQAIFSFLTNTRKRYQWDAFSSGNPVQEIARITYGNNLGNRISVIQPIIPEYSNNLLLQESYEDFYGGVIVYAPIQKDIVDMVLNGEDSSTIPILASGFIISSDRNIAYTAARDGASSSTTSQINGSVLTVVLQTLSNENMNSDQIRTLISSTIQKIKLSLNNFNFE